MVELVAPRRVAPRAAGQRLPAHRAVRASRSAAARGGGVAARQTPPGQTKSGGELLQLEVGRSEAALEFVRGEKSRLVFSHPGDIGGRGNPVLHAQAPV